MSIRALHLIRPAGPITGSAAVPGSKSYTNRALVIAALTAGETALLGPSLSDDSHLLLHALAKLGVEHESSADRIVVRGGGGHFPPFSGTLDVGPAGTTMRFLTALCAAAEGCEVLLKGSERMHERPIGELVDALLALGADVRYLGRPGCPPLGITGRSLQGGGVKLSGSVSSQYFSALLLIAPLLERGLTLEVQGEQVSRPYIAMTIETMREFGVIVENEAYRRYCVAPGQRYAALAYRVDGDASGASYLWALAAVSGGSVRVTNLKPESAQGDLRFARVLERMGCRVSQGSDWIEISGPRQLAALEIDLEDMPDTAQTLAVVAAIARGTTTIRGLGTLRRKETDRIRALATELKRCGIAAEEGPEQIVVHGGTPRGAAIETYEDHRMAMAFSVLAAVVDGVVIRDPQVVSKSFPTFWQAVRGLGIDFRETAAQ